MNAVHVVINKWRSPQHLDFAPSIPILHQNPTQASTAKVTEKPTVKSQVHLKGNRTEANSIRLLRNFKENKRKINKLTLQYISPSTKQTIKQKFENETKIKSINIQNKFW
jgi:hypothetical protein